MTDPTTLNFASFIMKLQKSPNIVEEFKNIDKMMEEAGLTDEQKSAIKTGDEKKIRELLGSTPLESNNYCISMC